MHSKWYLIRLTCIPNRFWLDPVALKRFMIRPSFAGTVYEQTLLGLNCFRSYQVSLEPFMSKPSWAWTVYVQTLLRSKPFMSSRLEHAWSRLWSDSSKLLRSKFPCVFERKIVKCAFEMVCSGQFRAHSFAWETLKKIVPVLNNWKREKQENEKVPL